jgi:RNA 2',3'-cyclic 3'-phosphodiesterase
VRLFVAVTPPAFVLDHLAAAVADVRSSCSAELGAALTWTLPAQWHLTLAFLGEVDDGTAGRLGQRLARLAGRHAPVRLAVAGAGGFGSARRARVLWAGVRGDREPLRRLARGVTAAAGRERIEVAGQRRYHPHLTLARARQPTDVRPLIERLAAYGSPEWTADSFALVRSRLAAGPGGRAVHEPLTTWPLRPAQR